MINHIFAFGSNFKHLNTALRSKYTIDYTRLQAEMKHISAQDYVVINTCNRSEIYGLGSVSDIQNVIFNSTQIAEEDRELFFAYQGQNAVEHIFSVVCGLNSQIIGDNEIAGQFKSAFLDAKKHTSINGLLEKMANYCLRASKEIKTNTELSNGTKSVSYAATKHIMNLDLGKDIRILVVGTGSTGRSVAKNIKEYIPDASLYLCNRTDEKALIFANEIEAGCVPFEQLSKKVGNFDVIVSCVTVKDKPLFDKQFNWADRQLHLIDLAVPSSVDQSLYDLPRITIKNVDLISKELYNTFVKRNRAVPVAKQIMEKHIAEFINWSKVYENKNAIQEWQRNFDKASHKCPFIKDLNKDAKQTLKHKSTALLVEFIRNAAGSNTDNIIEKYRQEASRYSTTCVTANDCIKNKLNCLICSNSN